MKTTQPKQSTTPKAIVIVRQVCNPPNIVIVRRITSLLTEHSIRCLAQSDSPHAALTAKVSSTCLVAVARNRYSVPCELAGQRVSTRLYPSRVEIATDEVIVASHARLSDRGHICYDWQHYIALIQRKPGALRNGAPFADMPAPLLRLRQGLMRHDGGDKTMAQVLNCVSSHGLEAVLVAVELVIESGALSTEHVLNVLARLNAAPVPESVQSSLPLGELPVANTGRYDSLRHGNTADVNHEAASLLELNHAS